MSDVEKAIGYLARWLPFWKERNEDSSHFVELAIAALREKAEREKGCEFVRCKDCKHSENVPRDMSGFFTCGSTEAYMSDDDYCSYGKKL